MCVEILLLLATTFTGREAMRQRGAYLVVREAHKVEADQQIKEAIERLVSLIHGEESHETKREEVSELVLSQGVAAAKEEQEEENLGEMDVIEV